MNNADDIHLMTWRVETHFFKEAATCCEDLKAAAVPANCLFMQNLINSACLQQVQYMSVCALACEFSIGRQAEASLNVDGCMPNWHA